MNLEILSSFGFVTGTFVVLTAVLLILAACNAIGLLIIRFSLHLDMENAPQMFKTNWAWTLFIKISTTLFNNKVNLYQVLRAEPGGYAVHKGLVQITRTCWNETHVKNLLRDGLASGKFIQGSFNEFSGIKLAQGIAVLLGIDCLIQWALWDLFSLFITAATILTPLTLRYLSGIVWSHGIRITKLEQGSKDETSE